MELKVRYRFDSPLPPFLIWHDPVIINEKLRKSYANRLYKISARSTDIPQSLRKSAKPVPKMSSGSSITPIYQKYFFLQNVAECCKMLQVTISWNSDVSQP